MFDRVLNTPLLTLNMFSVILMFLLMILNRCLHGVQAMHLIAV